MELKKMITDAQDLSQRYHTVMGPWEGTLLVTHLAAVVGRLADDVMTIEGKLPVPLEPGRLSRNIADALIQLIRLSNSYHLDLERAWIGVLEEAQAGLSNEAMVATMRDTIRQNQKRRKPG
jgi:hypothetical protein